MIDSKIQNLIQKRLRELPVGVQEVIASLDLEKMMQGFKEMQPLQQQQRNAIANEIYLIFLGLDDVASLTTNIRNSAQISRDRAEKISTAIQQGILAPNIDILEQVFENSEEETKRSTEDVRRVSTSIQNKIEQRPLPQNTSPASPQRLPNQPTPVKDLRPQAVRNPTPTSEAPNAFAQKLANPTLMKIEEEKVEVKEKTEDISSNKPHHVDPYREATG